MAKLTQPAFAKALLESQTIESVEGVVPLHKIIQQAAIPGDIEKNIRRAAAVTAVLCAGMLRAAIQLDADNAAYADKVVSGLGLAFIALDIVTGIAPIPSHVKDLKAYLGPLKTHLVNIEQGTYMAGELASVLKKILHDAIFMKARHGQHVPGFVDPDGQLAGEERSTRQSAGKKYEDLAFQHLKDLASICLEEN